MSNTTLFTPLTIGRHELAHRVVMAPLTRVRATMPGNLANAMMAEYYGQRASRGGLLIAEASPISQDAIGIPGAPGIWTGEQVRAWQPITQAVHAAGGVFFQQLWHMGRLSHPSHQPGGGLPIAPSAVAARVEVSTADHQRVPAPVPRAIDTGEIPALIERYVQAARHSIDAGFDGVEIHSANGYLLEQFLQSRTNRRTDAYGGSIANRCRLVIEITQALVDAIGAQRVAIRLSPFGIANDSGEDEPLPLYTALIEQLNDLKLAYLHLIEPRASGAGQKEVDHEGLPSAAQLFRPLWSGVLITAGNFKADTAAEMIADGDADAIAFGRYFISNPDLPERIRQGASFTPYNRATFYSKGPEGYTDYARLTAGA